MGSRNMIDSSFTKDMMSQVLTDLIRDVTDKSYQTQMEIAGQKMGIPERLANIAQLGQVSTSQGQSQQTNKLAPYDLMTQIILNQ